MITCQKPTIIIQATQPYDMKKLLPFLIAVSIIWLPSAKSQVTFIGENTTACEGSTVTVDVTTDNFNDIVSAQFGVTWDPAIVEFSAVTDNMPPNALYNISNAINGELRFSWFDFSIPPGMTLPNGALMFTITFNVLGNYGDVSSVTFGSIPGFPLEVANTGGIIPNANIVLIPGSVSIDDMVNPVISGCPSNIVVNVPHGQSSASVTWVAPTATDNCGVPTLTSTHNPGDVFLVGTTTVTYTATDGIGNTSTCNFDVTVIEDPLPPTALAFIAGDTAVNCPSTQVDIPMSVANFNQITSFQFGLTWDQTLLQYDSVTDNLPPVALYNDLNAGMGELRVSWFDFTLPIGMTLMPPDTVIFILHFTLLNPNIISTDVTFTSFPLFPIEVADTSGILNNADISFQSATVTIVDITPPVISGCPTNIIVDNDAGICGAAVTWTPPTATDNCSTVTMTSMYNPGDTLPVGTTTVTYTAMDVAGNSASCSFDVTVNDVENPVINNCPTNISVNNDPDSCNAVVNWTAPTANDNCPGVTLTSTHNSGDTFPVGTTTVTYTATDASGNSVTCSFDITVNDTEIPVALCQDITVALDSTGNVSVTTAQIDNGSTDNCGIDSLSLSPNAFTCAEVGSNTVTLTVTDVNGNSSTCTAIVTVEDNVSPVAVCQDITIQLDASGNASITGAQIDNGSTDACGIATLDVNPSVFDCSNVGPNTVTLTVTDVNGNSSTCTATVTVEDVTPPVALCQDITVQLDSTGSVTITGAQIDNGSSDACGIDTLESNPHTLDCSNTGANTVTLTVTDVNGNSSTCTATVTVEDNIAPSINCPADIVVSNDQDSCNAAVSWTDPVVSDNCPGTTFTSTITSGSIFDVGPATTVTYTATDASGNTATCDFTITVNDDQAPVITCPSDITLNNDTDSCGAVVAWSLPIFSDNCGVTSVDSTHASGDVFPVGVTTVTYTAHDAAGNSTSCSFDVTVDDTQAPVITCPADMTVSNDTDSCNAVVTWADPVVTDNCPNPAVTCSPSSGSIFDVGTTTVTCTVEDASGNTADCTFSVTVTDDQIPTLACPSDLTVLVPTGTIDTVITNIALVSSGDNCGVDTTYFHLSGVTSGDGANDASGTTFNVGSTTVTYYVKDAAGNIDSCSFDVTVEEIAGLILTCPSNVSVSNDMSLCSAVVNGLTLSAEPADSVNQVFYQMTGATPGSGPTDVSGTAFNVGITSITYNAQSNAGDLFSCTFTVEVNDTEPPAFLDCPVVNTTVGNSPNMCGIKFAGDVLPLATDNCPNMTVVYSPMAGTIIPLGTTTVSGMATDAAGNTANCSFDLIVVDDEAPLITNCPADITMDNDQDNCSAIVPWTEPTATDNCQLLAFTPSQGPNTSFDVGVTPVEYVAVDNVGNVSKCNFNVTVVDTQDPNLLPCPVSDTVSTVLGECHAIAAWTTPVATDNCGVVSLSSNLQTGDTLGVGTYAVDYLATDPAGNTTPCSFTLTVVDDEFPVIVGMPADMTIEATTGLCGSNITWSAPGATDNCGIDSFTSTASSGDFFAAGTTTEVEYVAVDVNGNVTVESFIITVEDNVPPAIDCPADAIVSVDGTILFDPSGVVTGLTTVDCDNVMTSFAGITATDDCGIASIVQTQGPASGSNFGLGSTIITYLVADNNSNQTTCSFAITVGALEAALADAFPLTPCEGEDVFFSVNEYSGATYTWKDPNGAVIGNASSFILSGLTAAQAGIYTVDISLPFNCSLQSSVEVSVAPVPQVEASSNDLLCLGGLADLQLTANDLAGAGVTSWIWEYPGGTFASGQNQTIPNATVDDSGTYTVTGVTANGCSSTATIDVLISDALAMPSLHGTNAAACTDDAITLNGQPYLGNSVTYHWSATPSAGSGLVPINNPIVEVNPTEAGDYVYNFYVEVDGCTSDMATWALNVQAPPNLVLSVDGQTECVDGTSSVTLTESGGEASTWTWTNANGDVLSNTSTATIDNVTAANSDVYEVTASTTNGCTSVATLPVTITNQPPDNILTASDTELCTGNSVTLAATPTYGANATFIWTGPGLPPSAPNMQTLSVVPGVTGNVTYSFSAVVDGCPTNTSEVTVLVEDAPSVNISTPDATECLDGSTSVTLVPNSPGAVSWVWINDVGGVIFEGENLQFDPATSANSGTYTVTVQSSIGCEGSGSYTLDITDALPEIIAVLDGPTCEGGLLYLDTDVIPGATYQWTGPQGLFADIRNPVIPNISSVLDGDYTVTATKDGCTSTSAPLPVKIITDPVVKADNFDVLFETPRTFNVVSNDVLEADYDINVIQQPAHGTVVYLGNGEFTYTPSAKFRETDRFIYEICYKDCPNACDFAIVTLTVGYPKDQCVITTVITPNEDGINDEFIISCLEGGGNSTYPNNSLLIFNQWGDKVFEAAPYQNDWRGTYEGKDLPDGTYFYIFKRDASATADKGFVMIYK